MISFAMTTLQYFASQKDNRDRRLLVLEGWRFAAPDESTETMSGPLSTRGVMAAPTDRSYHGSRQRTEVGALEAVQIQGLHLQRKFVLVTLLYLDAGVGFVTFLSLVLPKSVVRK